MVHKRRVTKITKKNLDIQYFSGSGSGGQHRNKHANCVRILHPESGAASTGQSHKERRSNIKEALQNLKENPKFKLWINKKVMESQEGKSIDEIVDELMTPENIKTEIKRNGKWQKE